MYSAAGIIPTFVSTPIGDYSLIVKALDLLA
jgi:hypothetical protein